MKCRRKVFISLKNRKHRDLICQTFTIELFFVKIANSLLQRAPLLMFDKVASKACFEMPSKLTTERREWPQCRLRCLFTGDSEQNPSFLQYSCSNDNEAATIKRHTWKYERTRWTKASPDLLSALFLIN